MKKYFILLFLIMTATAFAQTRTVATTSDRAIIVKTQSPQIVIKLMSNPSTGYSWFLKKYDVNIIMPVKRIYQASEKKIPGAGGHDAWTFKVKRAAFDVPRVTRIELSYRRPWEVKKGHVQTFVIVISPR